MNFDKKISKELALILIKPCTFDNIQTCIAERIGVEVMSREYGVDEDWVGLTADDYWNVGGDEYYQTFELWYPKK